MQETGVGERGVTLNIEARISKLEDRRPNTEYGIENAGARRPGNSVIERERRER
jgi:hypothetical protein